MRRSRRLWAVTLALGLSSTAAVAGSGPEHEASVVTDNRDPETLSARWRWIGVLRRPLTECPLPPDNWTGGALFPEPPPEGGSLPVTEPPVLHEFCVYETTRENPEPPFENAAAFVSLDPDFMGVMPSGAQLEAAYAHELARVFSSQAGDVVLPVLPNRPPVRLAIVDTAATRAVGAEDYRGTSEHGFTLLNLAKGLLCANGGCVAKVTSRLALGWKCFEKDRLDTSCRDAIDGGHYGLPSEMALAINREVQEWRTSDPDMRLVLNLSLGWAPELGGLEPADADVPAPALAVRTAIEHAVCEGALVIAAAGNRGGGPSPEEGALLPAAWETRAAPSLDRCRVLGVQPNLQNFPGTGQSPYRPLVFAAGGVRADNGRLFNSRTASEPRLVAFGDHAKGPAPGAAVPGEPGSGQTATLTGTSVGAFVVSAAAAAAWYYDRGLKPYKVPDTVYAGGMAVGRTAEVCLASASCAAIAVRRVTVCGAAVAAGGVAASSCPAPQAVDPSRVDLSGVTFTQEVHATDLVNTTEPIVACQGEALSYATALPDDPCPHWQYDPRGPAAKLEPQPGADGICPTCTYDPEKMELSIEIDGDFIGSVSGGVLKCGDATYSLDLLPMDAEDTAKVTDIDCAAADPIQLSFTVDTDKSATSPVQVIGPQ